MFGPILAPGHNRATRGCAPVLRLQSADMADLPKLLPGAQYQRGCGVGSPVGLRGIATSSSDVGVDQSASLNIEGLPPGSLISVTEKDGRTRWE